VIDEEDHEAGANDREEQSSRMNKRAIGGLGKEAGDETPDKGTDDADKRGANESDVTPSHDKEGDQSNDETDDDRPDNMEHGDVPFVFRGWFNQQNRQSLPKRDILLVEIDVLRATCKRAGRCKSSYARKNRRLLRKNLNSMSERRLGSVALVSEARTPPFNKKSAPRKIARDVVA
jgi:hypothetical protein